MGLFFPAERRRAKDLLRITAGYTIIMSSIRNEERTK